MRQAHYIDGLPTVQGFSAYLGYRDGIPTVFYRKASDPVPSADRITRAVSILATDRAEARAEFESMGF